MKAMFIKMSRLSAIFLLTLNFYGCQSHSNSVNQATPATNTSNEAVPINTTIKGKSDMMIAYCSNYTNVTLRANITAEMEYFCKNGAPTTEMQQLVAKINQDPEGKASLQTVRTVHSDDNRSEFWIVWGFKVPTAPIAFKDRPIYEYISKGFNSDKVELSGKAERLSDALVDNVLHLWSANINYNLTIHGSNGLVIPTQRNTQYNLYQLKVANDDLGLAVEHLTDKSNPDYTVSTMLNLSFKNDTTVGATGSINLTSMHISITNRGFPSTAVTAITQISKFLADTMYDALK